MKKVAVLTLYGNSNYGNKLQEYAVKKTCEKFGFKTYTIKNFSEDRLYKNEIFKIIINQMKNIKKIFKKYRNKNFKKFNKRFLNEDKKNYYSNVVNKKLSKKYDYFIIGSDQVWNPYFGLKGDFKFLDCADKKTKIAFSASFGIEHLKDNLDEYKIGLNNIKHISVREDAGKKIIEELTGRKDIEVLIDPTMLLTPEEWDSVSKKPKMLKSNKFILNYFLGNLSAKRKKNIERIAKKNNCEVINLLDKKSPFYKCGPSEFLYLEKHAFLICTDSFHSSVFAFLYNRPFIVFDREDKGVENMGSRLDTLINKFNLKNRRFIEQITKENLLHDYSEGYKILEKERKKSNNFLKKSLNIKE